MTWTEEYDRSGNSVAINFSNVTHVTVEAKDGQRTCFKYHFVGGSAPLSFWSHRDELSPPPTNIIPANPGFFLISCVVREVDQAAHGDLVMESVIGWSITNDITVEPFTSDGAPSIGRYVLQEPTGVIFDPARGNMFRSLEEWLTSRNELALKLSAEKDAKAAE